MAARTRTQPATSYRDPRQTIRARDRAARAARRAEQATDAGEAHAAAREYLLAAVKNADRPAGEAGPLVREYTADATHLIGSADMPDKRAAHYRAQLTDHKRGAVAQLARTLQMLHQIIDHHPDTDGLHTHYAAQLMQVARRTDAAHLRKKTQHRTKGGNATRGPS